MPPAWCRQRLCQRPRSRRSSCTPTLTKMDSRTWRLAIHPRTLSRSIGTAIFSPSTGRTSQHRSRRLTASREISTETDSTTWLFNPGAAGQLASVLNNGAGGWNSVNIANTERLVASADAVDVDQDGKKDVVALDGSGTIFLLQNVPPGGLEEVASIAVAPPCKEFRAGEQDLHSFCSTGPRTPSRPPRQSHQPHSLRVSFSSLTA